MIEPLSTTPARSVLITGGVGGIGTAMARFFAAQGNHHVALVDLVDETAGQKAASALGAEFPKSTVSFKRCDVSSWRDQAAVFQQVYEEHGGRLDIVMANAGISEGGATTSINLEEPAPSEPNFKVFDVNLKGVVYAVKLASHYMNRTKDLAGPDRGVIICTASSAGHYPFPVAPMYAASKAAVTALVRSLARPLEGVKIRINALAPQLVATPFLPNMAELKAKPTPMSTVIHAVERLVSDPSLSGAIAEPHGYSVTLRDPTPYVDEATTDMMETFFKEVFG